MKIHFARTVATVAALSIGLCGCANFSAPLAAPQLPVQPQEFRYGDTVDLRTDSTSWRSFADPTLEALVALALSANQDVQIALQRVRQARAGSAAAASRLLPTVALTASASDQRSGLPDDVKRGLPDTRAYRGALDLGWEIDIFGAARAATDAAEIDAQRADAGVEAARLLVATEVARQYITWQGTRLRLLQLDALLQTQRDTERLTRSRQSEGQASRFDVARAEGETQALAAQLPPLRALVAVSETHLAVLIGESPSMPLTALNMSLAPQLPLIPTVATGQSAELLRRRPDLRAAEKNMQAEGARLRESQADLWPKFFLAAVLGSQDLTLNRLNLSPARYSSVALAFTLPLFNAGRLRAEVEQQSARQRIATLEYERAVLGAVQDVENSLAVLVRERERGAALDGAVAARRVGLRHAESLHREGQIDLLPLLDAQRGLIAAELASIDNRTQQALTGVQLFKALGGPWKLKSNVLAAASDQPSESKP